jgi:gliding motility-associated-like protein
MERLSRIFIITIVLFFIAFERGMAQGFVNSGINNIEPLTNGQAVWVDLNDDGWLDLIITGLDQNGEPNTLIYESSAGLEFLYPPIQLKGLFNSRVEVADINNDNRLDLIISGSSNEEDLILVYINDQINGLTLLDHEIESLKSPAFKLVDLSNNGKLNIIITGNLQSNSVSKLLVYETRNQLFEEVSVKGLPSLTEAFIVPFDYDKDGKIDLFLSGRDVDDEIVTDIYLNEGNYNFYPLKAGFRKVFQASVDIGDFNEDGFIDILICGIDEEMGETCNLYYSEEGKTFSDQEIEIPLIANAIALTGDFDNDGKMDFVISGKLKDTDQPVVDFFLNKESGYEVIHDYIEPLKDGVLLIGDFDEDGGLDIFYSGIGNDLKQAILYLNNAEKKNTPPSFPTDMFSIVHGDTVGLFWESAIDDSTDPKSITYSITVVSEDGNTFPVSPLLNEEGIRKIVAHGGQSINTTYKFWGLPEGIYNWRIHAIDNSYKSSTTSGGVCITCPLTFVIHNNTEIEVCKGERVVLTHEMLAGKTVKWYSMESGYLQSGIEYEFEAQKSEFIFARVVLENGCSETIGFEVIVGPELDLGGDRIICSDETISFQLEGEWQSMTWFSENKGEIGEGASLDFDINESDRIWVEAVDLKNCIKKDTIKITFSKFEISAGMDEEICPNVEVTLGPESEENSEKYTYSWTPVDGLDDPNKKNPKAKPLQTTTYTLLATDIETGCESNSSVTIALKEPRIVDAGADRAICMGDATQLGGNPTAKGLDQVFAYEWFPSGSLNDRHSPNPIARPESTTTYMLIVNSESCPADTAYVTVNVNFPPVLGSVSKHVIKAGENIMLSVPGGVQYKWTPSIGLDRDDIPNPIASPTVSTLYKVDIIDENGCSASKEFEVIVNYSVYVPNVFSPNADGNNDSYKVFGYGIKRLEFQIYNRSGQLLYKTNSIAEALEAGWNGKFNGKEQPNGTYVWSLSGEFYDGSKILYDGKNSGKLTLVR